MQQRIEVVGNLSLFHTSLRILGLRRTTPRPATQRPNHRQPVVRRCRGVHAHLTRQLAHCGWDRLGDTDNSCRVLHKPGPFHERRKAKTD